MTLKERKKNDVGQRMWVVGVRMRISSLQGRSRLDITLFSAAMVLENRLTDIDNHMPAPNQELHLIILRDVAETSTAGQALYLCLGQSLTASEDSPRTRKPVPSSSDGHRGHDSKTPMLWKPSNIFYLISLYF